MASICFEGSDFSRVVIGDKENPTFVAEGIFPCEYYSPFDAANRQMLRRLAYTLEAFDVLFSRYRHVLFSSRIPCAR
jgi:hypothetical protein